MPDCLTPGIFGEDFLRLENRAGLVGKDEGDVGFKTIRYTVSPIKRHLSREKSIPTERGKGSQVGRYGDKEMGRQ